MGAALAAAAKEERRKAGPLAHPGITRVTSRLDDNGNEIAVLASAGLRGSKQNHGNILVACALVLLS